MAREESGARYVESEGNEGWRRAVAGFKLGGEQTTLSAASLCQWVIRSETGGSVTILLLSVYATGNDCRLLLM